MTDGFDQAIVTAVLNLLAADTSLIVYDGFVPMDPITGRSAQPPYAVLYASIGRPSADPDNSIDGRSRVLTARFYVHGVGGSATAARAVMQRIRTQLLDVVPVVANVSCGPLREMPDPPAPTREESTGSLYIDAVQVYELRAST